MNQSLNCRLAAITGIALAGAVALWWLGSARLALDHGSDTGRSGADAVKALLLVRGMALAITGVRAGAAQGWQQGLTAGVGLVAPAWPLVALAWSASTISLVHVVAAELMLLAGSAALPLAGMGLRRLLPKEGSAVVVGTVIGVAAAAAVWGVCGLWFKLPF